MFNYSLYSAILGLSSKWNISDISEDKPSGLIELHIKSNSSGTFPCAICGTENLPYSVHNKRWLYNNKLNIRFYVSLHSPRIHCKKCGDSHLIAPWNQSESMLPEPSEINQ